MVKDARITDPYVKQRIEDVRRLSGEATITKTATRLVLERIAQIEVTSSPARPTDVYPTAGLPRVHAIDGDRSLVR